MTDAELAAIKQRAAVALSRIESRHSSALWGLVQSDIPALVAALREVRAAATGAVAVMQDTAGFCRWCHDGPRTHKPACPVGRLAALVGEGWNG